MVTILSGPILKSVADIAKALGIDTFELHAEGAVATMRAMDPSGVMLIEATMPTPEPVPEPVSWRHDTKRFLEAAKPFFADSRVEVDNGTKWNNCTFKVGRRRRTLSLLDPLGPEAKPLKVPKALPWMASFTLPHITLKRMLSESDSIETFSGTDIGVVNISIRDGELRLTKGIEGTDRYEDAPLAGITGPDGALVPDCGADFTDSFLAAVIKPCVGKEMRVHLGTDLPIAFEYDIAGGKAFALCAPWMGMGE